MAESWKSRAADGQEGLAERSREWSCFPGLSSPYLSSSADGIAWIRYQKEWFLPLASSLAFLGQSDRRLHVLIDIL